MMGEVRRKSDIDVSVEHVTGKWWGWCYLIKVMTTLPKTSPSPPPSPPSLSPSLSPIPLPLPPPPKQLSFMFVLDLHRLRRRGRKERRPLEGTAMVTRKGMRRMGMGKRMQWMTRNQTPLPKIQKRFVGAVLYSFSFKKALAHPEG